MAAAQIPIVTNGTPVWASRAVQFRNLLEQVRDLGRELKGKAGACVNGSDYSQLESQFGLTSNGGTGTASTGYSFKFQLESVMAHLDSDVTQNNAATVIQQFLDQVG
jgi:hypothetical protein